MSHEAELLFAIVLSGRVDLLVQGREAAALAPGDAFVVPAGRPFALAGPSADLELLEMALPARFTTHRPAAL
jgi:mannose-6-phosphate isomerase-like protein (cupin superfamily)